MRVRRTAVLALLLLSTISCATQQGATQALWSRYQETVFDSAVYQRDHVRPLRPLTPEPDGTVLVATLTTKDGNVGDSITAGANGMWVTGVPEVKDICHGWTGDVEMRLRMLIGLPPNEQIPNMLILRANIADIFRPAPDASTSTRYPCATNADGSLPSDCGNSFPDGTTNDHYKWMAGSAFYLHQKPNGYPWTHLGYTYNWAPGADRYGASEYVIIGGKTATIVAKSTSADYCR